MTSQSNALPVFATLECCLCDGKNKCRNGRQVTNGLPCRSFVTCLLKIIKRLPCKKHSQKLCECHTKHDISSLSKICGIVPEESLALTDDDFCVTKKIQDVIDEYGFNLYFWIRSGDVFRSPLKPCTPSTKGAYPDFSIVSWGNGLFELIVSKTPYSDAIPLLKDTKINEYGGYIKDKLFDWRPVGSDLLDLMVKPKIQSVQSP